MADDDKDDAPITLPADAPGINQGDVDAIMKKLQAQLDENERAEEKGVAPKNLLPQVAEPDKDEAAAMKDPEKFRLLTIKMMGEQIAELEAGAKQAPADERGQLNAMSQSMRDATNNIGKLQTHQLKAFMRDGDLEGRWLLHARMLWSLPIRFPHPQIA